MPESRIAALASNPLLTQFAIDASQSAIKPIAKFLAPLCEVPSLSFHYKKYSSANRYRVPHTRRQPASPATVLGFTADDASTTLIPNALDFPIPNAEGLTVEELGFSIMEGQSILADASGLAHESETITTAINALTAGKDPKDFGDDTVDPITYLDNVIGAVKKAAKNGAAIKILWGWDAFRKFRNNKNVRGRFIVGAGRSGGNVGTISPTIGDVGGLLINNPECELSEFVLDRSAPGADEDIEFLLAEAVIVFASNATPNRMDPSFMKTFTLMGNFFKPGQYQTVDQRDQVLKMDWITKIDVTNSAAAQLIDTTTLGG
jgi:hypothetical protein